MTTIITAFRNQTRVGRCDKTCYNGTGKSCTCICGGRNHGQGILHALATAPDLARTIAAENHDRNYQIVQYETTRQKCLFLPDIEPSSASTPQETSDPIPSSPVGPVEPSGS